MVCRNVNKALQRKLYDGLSEKRSLLVIVFGIFLVVASVFQFSETLVEWSKGKYIAVFNKFHDNLRQRSFQDGMCQYLPMDVVYTWVNGSDPEFQNNLKNVRESLYKNEPLETRTGCDYPNCALSHFVTTSWKPTVKLKYVREQNVFLSKLVDLREKSFPLSNNKTKNVTLFSFDSWSEVSELVNRSTFSVGYSSHNLSLSFWTTEWTVPHCHAMDDYVILSKVPQEVSEDDLGRAMPLGLSMNVSRIWLYKNLSLAVVQLKSQAAASLLMQHNLELKFHNRVIKTDKAYLILQMTGSVNEDTTSAIRFNDNEELRYSLRSLERFAPWVRHVYLVTNGQIPYWLDTDSPRLTIVRHDEIFENSSHLPTFSSPAIEANIHKIAGLSQKFIYMNDDVFLGSEVWPEDFYTARRGSKIFLTWSLPDCAKGCPSSWLADGYCDERCNTTECVHDGGDCLGNDIVMGVGEHPDWDPSKDWITDQEDRCSENCADTWIGDKFCDESCDTESCGFDAGDCGLEKLAMIQTFDIQKISNKVQNFVIKPTVLSSYWNLSGLATDSSVIRADSCSNTNLRSLSFNSNNNLLVAVVKNNTRSSCDLKVSQVFSNGTRTTLSFVIAWDSRQVSRTKWRTFGEQSAFVRKLVNYEATSEEADGRRPGRRRLLDAFGDSLLYVNNIYNKDFGFVNRRVPAHMPHLVDKEIVMEMQEKYRQQWEETSSHKVRSKRDMQFAFSYQHYIMHQTVAVDGDHIFDKFDTDKSGTWSDREIRTILAQIQPLPINYEDVKVFENVLLNCSSRRNTTGQILTDGYKLQLQLDRYHQSKLPLVTKSLVKSCPRLVDMIKPSTGNLSKYKFEIVAKPEVTFKTLSSDLGQVVGTLDSLRKSPNKFFCINDNTDPSREDDNEVVRVVLQDFLESVLPSQSQFELGSGYRNRFLHLDQLLWWRWYRFLLQSATYLCFVLIIALLLTIYFNIDTGQLLTLLHLDPLRQRRRHRPSDTV